MKLLILKLLKIVQKIKNLIILNASPSVEVPPIRPNNYYRFYKEEVEASYQYFKKYFSTSIFLSQKEIRKFAITKSLLNNNAENYLFLEFGVWRGETLNYFSNFINDKKIFGFDSFTGLKDDWVGTAALKGEFILKGKIPKLKSNAVPIKGWVQDTLPDFLTKNPQNIQFVHMDLDTYESSKFVLSNIKDKFIPGTVIIFDQYYNYSGWKNGEFKALQENLPDDKFKYLAFSTDNCQVVIEII